MKKYKAQSIDKKISPTNEKPKNAKGEIFVNNNENKKDFSVKGKLKSAMEVPISKVIHALPTNKLRLNMKILLNPKLKEKDL